MSLFFILAVFTNLIADAVKERVLAIQTQMTYEIGIKVKENPKPTHLEGTDVWKTKLKEEEEENRQ